MSDVVIKVENLSKQYRLGTVGTGTLSHDLNRIWAKVRGKEDPYLKIGESNDRTQKGESDYVWALKDVSFEVKQGEVLGVVGKNGAGKSTLLKILSQITKPTTGSVKMKGRVGSLLEVGTGFHHDLTGRENIYLNGAILGMRKWEIDKKLDEIVDFAGIERYVDTPVKRYSSGMMVRLGFAVAAHLEPEILIVDEVLAVGDVEFQKKCLGKMKDVSRNEGRTILFVSHNMDAILKLTGKSLLMKVGHLDQIGSTDEIVNKYMNAAGNNLSYARSKDGNSDAYFNWIKYMPETSEVTFEAHINQRIKGTFSIQVCNSRGIVLYTIRDVDLDPSMYTKQPGIYSGKVKLMTENLVCGTYYLTCSLAELGVQRFDKIEKAVVFEVLAASELTEISTREGSFNVPSTWDLRRRDGPSERRF